KFSPRGGSVGVSLSFPSDTWQLRVSDEGPGIPVADRERVFERFTRLGDELRRETRGTGIGLSLVKHIIEAHGGTVRIVDCDRGGAEFILCASLDPGAASRAQPTST
ncbi:MAG: sensor histidine kinase, partial [Verrucomicrobiales bacterium]